MLLSEAEYKIVKVDRSKLVKEAVYGCDECGAEIANYPNEDGRLTLEIFDNEGGDSDRETLHFCSWECVIRKLQTIDCNYFIALPYVMMNKDGNKSGKHLIEILSKLV